MVTTRNQSRRVTNPVKKPVKKPVPKPVIKRVAKKIPVVEETGPEESESQAVIVVTPIEQVGCYRPKCLSISLVPNLFSIAGLVR